MSCALHVATFVSAVMPRVPRHRPRIDSHTNNYSAIGNRTMFGKSEHTHERKDEGTYMMNKTMTKESHEERTADEPRNMVRRCRFCLYKSSILIYLMKL